MRFPLLFALLAMAVGTVLSSSCSDQNIETHVTLFNSTIIQTVFASSNAMEVYIRTASKDVYRSVDSGKTFVPIMNQLDGFYDTFDGNTYGVLSIRKGAADGLVYFVGASGRIYWITVGNGEYTSHTTGNDHLYQLIPHANDPNLVLRALHTCDDGCRVKLDLSSAKGIDGSWTLVRDYVFEFGWGVGTAIICVSVDEDLMVGDFTFISLANRRLFVSFSLDDHFSYRSEEGFFDYYLDSTVLYAVHYDEATARSDLFISPDFGQSYSEAVFKNETQMAKVDNTLFTILDSEGVSFLSVCSGSDVSNLYQADLSDGEYWFTLANHRSYCGASRSTGSDFQKINGMYGVYFANTYDIEAFEKEGEGSDKEDFIQSVISFNKGGVWSGIPTPEGSACNEPNCALHLFSLADQESEMIFSTSRSIGLAVATGTESTYRLPLAEANTYLSRNGGFSWEQIKNGTFAYQLSHHGSLLVMTSLQANAEVSYSWSQGLDFASCTFHSEPILPQSFLDVSPSKKKLVFMLQGLVGDDTSALAIIDFTKSTPRDCTGESHPNTEKSDYELVEPQANGICLMGQRTLVTRRKRDAVCLSESEHTQPLDPCQCTRLDYTCGGACWKEDKDEQGNVVCVNDCVGLSSDPQAAPEDCLLSYEAPSGYQLVDGNQCIEGLQLGLPISLPCPSVATPEPFPSIAVESPSASPVTSPSVVPSADEPSETSWTSIMIVGSLAVLIVVLLVVSLILVLYKSNSKVRGLLNTYLPASMGGGSGSTKQYSVLGDLGDPNSLFGDDDMFLDDQGATSPKSSNRTPLGSLLDFEDDDAEGAIDIQL